MPGTTTRNQRVLLFTGAMLGWFALILQLYLIIENRTASVPETILRYFGFFTILTNILTALCFSFVLAGKNIFFHKPGTQAAIGVYILVVGLVYNLVLRFLWKPEGMTRLADELLHSVMPLFYLIYWFIYGSKQPLQWKQVWAWMLYPLVYVLYTLLRGSIVGYYPYPFINVTALGYPVVLRNSLLLTFVFLGLALLFVAITRWKNKRSPS